MSRVSLLSSPLLLGFEEMERLIDRVGKSGDGYPPYNIERISVNAGNGSGTKTTTSRENSSIVGSQRDNLAAPSCWPTASK
jgi:hypothetical protein